MHDRPQIVPAGTPRGLAHARRQARRSLAAALAVPLSTALVLLVVVTGYYLYEAVTTVLEPAQFERLTVGAERSEIEPLLPEREVSVAVGQVPEGADCHSYRSDRDPFDASPLYRVCFADGVLVSKDRFAGTADEEPR